MEIAMSGLHMIPKFMHDSQQCDTVSTSRQGDKMFLVLIEAYVSLNISGNAFNERVAHNDYRLFLIFKFS